MNVVTSVKDIAIVMAQFVSFVFVYQVVQIMFPQLTIFV
jgi:hypothetical protein